MFKIVIIPGLIACAAFAQDVVFQKQAMKISDEASFGPIGITAAFAGPMASIPGAPYSAEAVTQHVQLLPDGNRITQTTTNNVARDSQGRVRREESLPGLGNGGVEAPHLVLIEDPVAGTHITLDSNSKTAMKLVTGQMLAMKKGDEAGMRNTMSMPGMITHGFATAGPGQPGLQMMTEAKMIARTGDKSDKTDLGTQTIEGVVAKGTKLTHTIPPGEIGNDLPIVITTETWFSPELKVLVMSKSSDPRMGETSYRLTNLSRTEPDPALFQIPADYAVKDQPVPDVFMYKKADR